MFRRLEHDVAEEAYARSGQKAPTPWWSVPVAMLQGVTAAPVNLLTEAALVCTNASEEELGEARRKAAEAALPGLKTKAAWAFFDSDDPTAASEAAIAYEVARVQAMPAAERHTFGSRFTDPEAVWSALEEDGGEHTKLVRASWLIAQRGGRLFKRPGRGRRAPAEWLPEEAYISPAELREIHRRSHRNVDGTGGPASALPLIALSHYWRTLPEPDPRGVTLDLVISALEAWGGEFAKHSVSDLGI